MAELRARERLKSHFPKIGSLWGIKHLSELVRTFDNWYIILFDFLMPSRKIILKMKKGPSFVARPLSSDQSDIGVIIQNWLLDEYANEQFNFSNFKTILDIGAHIGAFSIYAALRARSAVVLSYEPLYNNFCLFRENVRLNKVCNVKLFNLGLASTSGKRELRGLGSATFSLYNRDGRPFAIQCITLEDVFAENNLSSCDFVKMDCEGGEYEILLSTPRTILEKIRAMSIEYHDYLFQVDMLPRLTQYLAQCGFAVSVSKDRYHARRGFVHVQRN